MALDEQAENDTVIEEKGVTFLIENSLLEEAKPIQVDFITTPTGSGFRLSSSLSTSGGCGGGCSSC
jgi:Fe-S cluster assembly iron-binding protein IscA